MLIQLTKQRLITLLNMTELTDDYSKEWRGRTTFDSEKIAVTVSPDKLVATTAAYSNGKQSTVTLPCKTLTEYADREPFTVYLLRHDMREYLTRHKKHIGRYNNLIFGNDCVTIKNGAEQELPYVDPPAKPGNYDLAVSKIAAVGEAAPMLDLTLKLADFEQLAKTLKNSGFSINNRTVRLRLAQTDSGLQLSAQLPNGIGALLGGSINKTPNN